MGASWSVFGSRLGVILGSRKRYEKQSRFRNDLKSSWNRPGGVLDGGRLEAPQRPPGGVLGRPWRVFFLLGVGFLLVLDFSRISSRLGPHFFTIFEATTGTHQTRIWIGREAKVLMSASPGIL